MHKINSQIHAYIRCIKLLWNEFYRALPDGEHDFADVQELIWNTLVIKLLYETMEDIRDGQIVVKPLNPSVKVLVGASTKDTVKWTETTRDVGDALFLFEDFVDFRNWENPRELQYAECWTMTLPKEHLLIQTDAVDFYYKARQPN